MSQQPVIDSLAFSSQGGSLTGRLLLSRCSRLSDQIEPTDGALDYRVSGKSGAEGEPMLVLEIEGLLLLRCQRCLKTLDHPLKIVQEYELRDGLDEDTLMQEDMEDDSRDFLEASRSLDVVSLIEDEVLLALPVVPRHEACDLPGQGCNPEAASPFGVLRSIKGQTGKTH
jgi:uncharacterized protein